MNNPSSTDIDIIYNGKNVTRDIIEDLLDFTYIDVASGQTDTLAIILKDDTNRWINKWFPKEGDYIKAYIKVKNWEKQSDNRKLLCGKFLLDDFNFDGPPTNCELNGIASPINTNFAHTEKTKTWKNVTIEGIASSIAKNAGIKLSYSGGTHKIKELEQSGQTDLKFLFSLCEDYNLAMKLYNAKLVIFDETQYEKKKSAGTITKSQCSSYSLNSTLVGIYHGVVINYKSLITVAGKRKKKKKKTLTLSYKYMLKPGKRILKVNQRAESLKDAEIKAKAALRKANKKETTVTLKLKGDIKYLAGTCYDITGFGKFNGKYYIDKVTHNISRAGYTVTLEMHKVLNIVINENGTKEKSSNTTSIGEKYVINKRLTGYKTADEAKNLTAKGKTGTIYPGSYYIYNKSNGMLNVTKVKGCAGSWINPSKN